MSQKTAKECRRAERECKAQALACKEYASMGLRCNRNCLNAMKTTEEAIQAFGHLEDIRRELEIRRALVPLRVMVAVHNVVLVALALAVIKALAT